jgi:hypothetical protein
MRNARHYQIAERFKNDPKITVGPCGGQGHLPSELFRLPRTEANLAAVLVDEVGKATPLSEVEAAASG